MQALVNSDITRLVARLVLGKLVNLEKLRNKNKTFFITLHFTGYLEDQDLPDAYKSFCESSRHLTKEYLALQSGSKSIDTSSGLVNIISDYFLIKATVSEFLRVCPKSPIVIKIIETSEIRLRLELILKIFKDNLNKFDEVPENER